MKNLKKVILLYIFGIFLISSFLIPRTTAQEWTYDGVDTESIPNFSVFPSEWYIYDSTNYSADILFPFEIIHGNISDPVTWGNGTCVWGNGWTLNTTSGEKTLDWYNFLVGYWNGTQVGILGIPYIIPVENDGNVSLAILNNIAAFYETGVFVSSNFENQQVYPNIYSIAFWNTTFNTAHFKLNFTNDGILTQLQTHAVVPGNMTLYSQPAQLTPVFSFTTENDTLIVNSTDADLKIAITDADNNNDGAVDTDYLYRIFFGSTWTSWMTIPPLIDFDLGSVSAGNYIVIMEVKNMYGVTQEQITIQYTPSETPTDGDGEAISGYPIYLVSIVAMVGVLIMIYRYCKKLRL